MADRPVAGLPLRPGATGEPVRDLRRRLATLGFASDGDPDGAFGPSTGAALTAFQAARRLPVDGTCDQATWEALVEAGWTLGDRFLYLTVPMQRGDDVASLQHRLGALGFDAGKVDGIFGKQTALAVADFQHNAGIVADGVAGPVTVANLLRLQGKGGDTPVVRLREAERLRGSGGLASRRVAVGETGGLAAIVEEVCRGLEQRGARAFPVHHPDGVGQAAEANALEVIAYVGLAVDTGPPGCSTSYYASPTFETPAGRRLGEALHTELVATLDTPDRGCHGLALPVLRETRMPAALSRISPPELVSHATLDVAGSVSRALEQWLRESC